MELVNELLAGNGIPVEIADNRGEPGVPGHAAGRQYFLHY